MAPFLSRLKISNFTKKQNFFASNFKRAWKPLLHFKKFKRSTGVIISIIVVKYCFKTSKKWGGRDG